MFGRLMDNKYELLTKCEVKIKLLLTEQEVCMGEYRPNTV